MNIVDRIVTVLSPQAGLSRARARIALEAVRSYDAASKGRRTVGLRGRGTGANAEIGPALRPLRDAARDLARNTPHGVRMLDVLVSHTIGTGISVVWETGSDRADRLVRTAYEDWSRQSDITAGGDFAGLQALALRSTIEGGDCLLRLVDLPMSAGRRIPFAIQGLEGDHIDAGRDSTDQTSRLGVRLDSWGAPTGWWVYPQHPGDAARLSNLGGSVELAAADGVHLFRKLRFGQVRGVSWLAPMMLSARDLADLMEAVIVKAKVEACFSGFVTTAQGAASPQLGQAVASTEERVERLKPGALVYLADGEDVKFAAPSSSGQFGDVAIATLQAMAVSVGLTYDQVTGDLRQANYSSLRAGKIEQRRLVEQIQWLMIAPQMMAPILSRFVDRAILAGALAGRRQGYAYRLVMPRVEPIDPKKDLEADILAVRAGLMSPQEFTAGWGVDWRDNLAAFEQWFAAVDAGGMVFDIDPRRTSQTGVTNSTALTDQGQAQ